MNPGEKKSLRREHGCYRGGCLGVLIGGVGTPLAWLAAWIVGATVSNEPLEPFESLFGFLFLVLPILGVGGGVAGLLLGALVGTIEHHWRRNK